MGRIKQLGLVELVLWWKCRGHSSGTREPGEVSGIYPSKRGLPGSHMEKKKTRLKFLWSAPKHSSDEKHPRNALYLRNTVLSESGCLDAPRTLKHAKCETLLPAVPARGCEACSCCTPRLSPSPQSLMEWFLR